MCVMLSVYKYYSAVAGKQTLGWEARPVRSRSPLAMTSSDTLTSLGLGFLNCKLRGWTTDDLK